MNIKPLSDALSASPQISLGDLDQLKALGFNSIIICRPDGEEGQPSADQITEAASQAGLEAAYAPMAIGQNPMEALPAFNEGMERLAGPTLGYCKSGMRVSLLWALSQKGKQSADDIVAAAADAGFDLSRLKPILD